jgi:bifunctional UDP-N-acetylglucosamine pyrophosphorylase/glucosamine-1-phosphate N-acetyltransferase
VTIHCGSKLFGPKTYIGEGARIGFEAPATVTDCYVGPHVALNGGFFQEAVFLEKSSCGSGSHVRRGTIMEERASIAHTVGLKQTILFPYVTLGSLINFCDCFMAGGTGRDNHSEVGSSYIHFNFTPSQDKATPSLIGDVPQGVMLNQSPIFLGGQGGLVGPCRLAYGTVVAAGSICRKDQLKEDCLVVEGPPRAARIHYRPGGYGNLKRILGYNFTYIGQLYALYQWYRQVRSLFVGRGLAQELLEGLIVTLSKGIDERVVQLEKLGEKLGMARDNPLDGPGGFFFKEWTDTKDKLHALLGFEGVPEERDKFLTAIGRAIGTVDGNYLDVIKALDRRQTDCGSRWLQSIVDHVLHTLGAAR